METNPRLNLVPKEKKKREDIDDVPEDNIILLRRLIIWDVQSY